MNSKPHILLEALIVQLITCQEIICNHSCPYTHRYPFCQFPSPIIAADGGLTGAGLDIPSLHRSVQRYYSLGSAPSTWKAYNSGINQYSKFCSLATRDTVPTSESTLLLFVTHLASLKLSHSTIKVYLSRVHSLHVAQGHHDSFNKCLTPRLYQVIKDIQKDNVIIHAPRIPRPITIEIMKGIKEVLLQNPHDYNNIMMWAACCLAFFGFLHSSEFTTLTSTEFNLDSHLSAKDVAMDNKLTQRLIRVRIKQKMDPFRQGVTLFLGKTGLSICPVDAILPYLGVRGNRPDPLFTF